MTGSLSFLAVYAFRIGGGSSFIKSSKIKADARPMQKRVEIIPVISITVLILFQFD